MRKIIFLLVTILCTVQLTAQDNLVLIDAKFPKGNLEQQSELIKQTISETKGDRISFKLRFFNKSKHSKHYTFDVFFNKIPVFSNFIKVNTDSKDNIIFIAKGIGNLQDYSAELFSWEQSIWAKQEDNFSHWPNTEKINNTHLAIFENENHLSVVQIQNGKGKNYDKTKAINLAGELIGEWDHLLNLGIDTFINANVFEPDPLTFLSKMYGSPYVDSNDQDLPWMSAAYLPVNIPAVYDTFVNQFFIENDYVKLVDILPPNNTPAQSANNNFFFNRSQTGFEEVNVAYHITQFHDHIAALGYDTLMDLQVEVDAHGGFGDNSVFHRNVPSTPFITFGDGGVDDAEDADVIVHEYCHGISWSANGNTHSGNERIALDEGIADYFATSYSRNLSAYRWEDMFTWDGHNEHWLGRTANTPNNYTKPWASTPHLLGEVFNTAMQKIYTDLGRNTTDELMLEALFYFTDSTNLPSAAYYVLQADDLINGGANRPIICQHFKSKNLLSWDCYPTSTSKLTKNELFKVKNSLGFSQGTGNLMIDFSKNTNVQLALFDINGRKIFSKKQSNSNFALNPANYMTGIYILKIQSTQGVQTVKLSRQ